MATLSRRQDDGGFYIRTGRGYYGTKQVHPDAVRFLNKRDVFVGDEIPPDAMSTLMVKPNWLFTKEEFPHVVFFEFDDPSFGMRSASRSAVQGTTRVYSFNYSAGSAKARSNTQASIRQSSKRRTTSKQLPESGPGPQSKKRGRLSAEGQYKKAKPELNRAKAARAKVEQESAEARRKKKSSTDETTWIFPSAQAQIDGSPEIGAVDRKMMDVFDLKIMNQPAALLSRLKHWYVSGGDLPLWMVVLFVVLLLVASQILSRVM